MQPRKHVVKIPPYRPPPKELRKGSLKLDWNEAPSSPPAVVVKAVQQAAARVNHYGFPLMDSLQQGVAKYAGVSQTNVLITAGSDAAHELLCRTYLNAKDKVIISLPTYGNFEIWPQEAQATLVYVGHDTKEIIKAITQRTRIIYLINPYIEEFSLKEIGLIAKKAPKAIVIVDEAYVEYGGETAAPLLKKYKNIVIMRSFSKAFRLAGLRVGYILADAAIISNLLHLYNIKSVNILGQVAADASIKHKAEMLKYVAGVRQGMQYASRELQKHGFSVKLTNAGFLFFSNPDITPKDLKLRLAREGLLVKADKTEIRMAGGPVSVMKQAVDIICAAVLKSSASLKELAMHER